MSSDLWRCFRFLCTKSSTIFTATNNVSPDPLQSQNWTVCWVPRIPWLESWRTSAARWESNWRSWQKTAGQYFLFDSFITSPSSSSSSFVCLLTPNWLIRQFFQSFIYSLSCLFRLSVGRPCHHFVRHHLSRLFGQIMSTYYILLLSLTCFLVNLMLQ